MAGVHDFLLRSVLVASSLASQPAISMDYLAYGELRGQLEPCGCDPATDLGGIRRLAIVLGRERGVHSDLVAFDLGNDLPLKGEASLKTPFLLAAATQLSPGAILMNQLELERLAEIEAIRRQQPEHIPPYVLSNALPTNSIPSVASELRRGKGWVALGYTYVPEFKHRLQQVGPTLLQRWRTLLADVPVGQRVLLFAGPTEDLQVIVQAKLFDVYISSNSSPLLTVIGADEKEHPEKLVRLASPPVLMVPLGGQGMLRGGALQAAVAQPVADYIRPAQPKGTATAPEPWLKPLTPITWVTPEASEADSPMKGVYAAYTKAAQASFRDVSAQRRLDLKLSPYAGVQACQGCHIGQAKTYAATKHAQAMHTLEIRGKQEDAACVACHVVGAKVKGGFVSMVDSPGLSNVQCENCHGPRLAHTKNPGVSPVPLAEARQVCVGCHNRQHSPQFNFDKYWPKIAHGKNP